MLKVISCNVNGIRAAARKGFYEWIAKEQPDFVCLQEVKADADALDHELFYPQGYYTRYSHADKKGYSGVAIYARKEPETVYETLGFPSCDTEGRYIQFDYPDFSIASIYFPSGTSGDSRQNVKYDFLEQILPKLIALKEQGRELILCGDYNIAHRPIDLKNWRANQKTSGFLPEERAWMEHLFTEAGFIDAFRVLNQEADQYTWWSMRSRTAWDNNVGWRIDYQVITPGLVPLVQKVGVYREQRFSDHAPVVIEYAFNGASHA